MIPIQQHGKRWLILTLTLSTSVLALASIGASQPVVFADENSHLQSQKNTNKIEVLDWKTFSEKLNEYSSNQRQFHVLKLGFENRLGTLSTREELEEFGKNNNFLVINGKVTQNIHDFPHILVMNKGDVIAHNEEEYHNQMRELRFSGNGDLHNSMEPKRIHALFKIELDSNKRQLLNAAGLGTAENSLKNINGITIYSHGLTVDNKYYENYSKYNNAVKNINVTKERFIANDDLIHKLIESSEAMKQSSERDKVKAFVQYVANHTTYDWEAANKAVQNYADINYYLGSDLFAVTERQKAMCVGFSTTAARAFNMLGLPAYVVVGKNAEGVPHATARVYYDKKWHTIDGTGFITGNKHQRSAKYSEKHFSTIGEDSYDVVEAGQEPKAERNYMIIDSNYESWAMKQKTADLLLFNKEKSLVGLDHIAYVEPTYITENKKNHLLDIYKALKRKVEETKATDKDDKQEGYDRVLQFVNSDIDKLSTLSKITEEEFKALENSMDLARMFLGQMNAKAGKEFSEGETYQSYLKNRQKNNTNSDDRNRNELQENQANSDEVTPNSKDASAPSVNSAQQSEELEGTPSTQETISVTPSQQTPAPKALQAKTELEDKTEPSSLGNTEMVSPSSEIAQNTVDSKEESDAKLPHVEVASKESSEAQVNTVSSPQVSSASQTSPETNSTEAVTTSQEMAGTSVSAPQVSSEIPTSSEIAPTETVTASQEVAESRVSAPQVSSEIQTLSETAPADEVTESSVVESDSASQPSPETNSTEAVTTSQEMAGTSVSVPQVSSEIQTSSETAPADEVTESSVVESDSASPTSPETNSTEVVVASQEMAESSVSAPQVSSEIQTSSETTPTDVATEVTEPSVVESDSASPTSSETISVEAVTEPSVAESNSASQPSPETNSAEVVTTSQEMAGTSVSAPQVSSEIPTSSETTPTDVATEVTEPSVVESDSASQPSSETISTDVATEVTESSVVESNSASQPSPETTPTETITASQEIAEPSVSAPQTSSASLTLEVPKNERLDKEVAVTVSNGVEANTHEAGSVPTSDIHVQDAGSATVIQPRSVLGEAISTVEPVGVTTSPQERSAVASEVKVPASLERSNNSVEEEKVVDSNATIENQETEKKEVFTSENVLNSLVTIWVALSTSFFMRYFSRGK
ncbi:transglutaminase domain-containing protein [Streptococcus suis]|uniref:Ribonuclease n=1 Tax=Streptococcus suis TaxID=1307 RepID=A0A4T2H1S6_STRSU|nr:transglutaminase domain-containing protein [Streptococcus suis]MBO3837473.1 ribonuclease [Streptococcus suis]MBO4113171.1 ribonuclease [Streptococcus suis]MDG4479464.1 ribonuclease [Streptococcus suis]MDG4485756.1 ribonuclease [Streptococcus suis]TII05873.1 ribonuclease [Streptococcus suis]